MRRRGQLGSVAGAEFNDLCEQAANDALLTILAKLEEFKGMSRFTTWAYKFVVFEVSRKVARHAGRRQPPNRDDLLWEALPDAPSPRPEDTLEQREEMQARSAAIGGLTERQREVFVAIAINEIPTDIVAVRLGSNRNAIYTNLFDARRRLRATLAAPGHPLADEAAVR